jgi:hypothetical protein
LFIDHQLHSRGTPLAPILVYAVQNCFAIAKIEARVRGATPSCRKGRPGSRAASSRDQKLASSENLTVEGGAWATTFEPVEMN